jgi:hypothetical protein
MYAIEFEADLKSEYVRIPQFEKLKNKHVKVIVLADTIEKAHGNINLNYSAAYDFSDLVGKLEWQGDALTEQKALRDEW